MRRRSPAGSRQASPGDANRAERAGPIRRSPDRARYIEMVRGGEGPHRRRRRLPVRPVAARGAADVRLAARPLPGAAPRQPVAVPLPPRARRDRPRRLVAGAARRLRERPREPLPDRRHDRADRGRRRAAALVREGPGRARDARRPRAQRSLARLQGRHGPRRARHGGGAVLARLAPRLRGRRRAPRRRRRPSTSSARASRPAPSAGRRRCGRCS